MASPTLASQTRVFQGLTVVAVACPDGFSYSSFTNSCYLANSVKRCQFTAGSQCKSYGSNVHLVAIQSAAELDVVKDLAVSLGKTYNFTTYQLSNNDYMYNKVTKFIVA